MKRWKRLEDGRGEKFKLKFKRKRKHKCKFNVYEPSYLQATYELLTDYLQATYKLLTSYLQATYKLLTSYLQATYKPLNIMIPRKKKKTMHEDLEGFDINVNSLGELESNFDIDKINEFLNKNLEDKKIPDEEPAGKVDANEEEDEMEFEADEEEDKMEFEADEEWEEE